ncbi:MAG: hypothetical protein O7F70_01950 [Gemmatimonadetes bacterium]|nr:hypothetical protein [Gemmatimonadota bacterium]
MGILRSGRTLGLGLALGAGATFACVYPTERSEQLRVVMDPIPELLRGELWGLSAQVVDANGNLLENAEIVFSSSDPLIATVNAAGDMVTVSVGTAEVTAEAVEFAGATSADQLVRIHDLIEIDSVRPRVLRFGDTVTIFGAGLNPEPFILVSLGGAETPIKSYTPDTPDEPNRFGRLTVWVPPPTPAFTAAVVLGVEGLATGLDTIRVFQRDIYEPNDTIPWDFGVLDQIIRNPALAFEQRLRDDSLRTDWYRFTQAQTRDRTILIRSNSVGPGTYAVFFTDSLVWDGAVPDFGLGPGSWSIGPSLYACQGIPFAPPQQLADSVVIALKDLPAGQYDILAAYTTPGAYEMAILPLYRSALPPDAFEENDWCDVAPQLPLDVSRTLTIDNPHDIDWFRFTVGADGRQVTFDVDALEPEADLDIYVLRDDLPAALTLMGLSNIGGATDEVVVPLDAGDYFLVVVDFAGVPTEYSLTSVDVVAIPDMLQAELPEMPLVKSQLRVPVSFKSNR